MGDWRRVQIVGTCGAQDVPKLRAHLAKDFTEDGWGCLHSGGICGLPNWGRENIDVIGNLGERDYTPQSVGEELARIVEAVAPSLNVRVYVGEEYEGDKCVATVSLGEDGAVVGPPEIENVPPISEDQLRASMMAQFSRPQ
jgi:hypothetical protein